MLQLVTEDGIYSFGDYEFCTESCVILNGEFGSYLIESIEAPKLKEALKNGMPCCREFPYLYDTCHGSVKKNFTKYLVPVIIHAEEPYSLTPPRRSKFKEFAERLEIIRGLYAAIADDYDEDGIGLSYSIEKLAEELL